MLVGRVERIFTRVGGTQLQSLAHPPRGRDLVSELWWDVMLTWLFCIFEGEQLALHKSGVSRHHFCFLLLFLPQPQSLVFVILHVLLHPDRVKVTLSMQRWAMTLTLELPFLYQQARIAVFRRKKIKDYHVCINILYIDLVFLKLCLVKSWKTKDNLNNKS